jgi:rod shape-determining protein MreC
MDWELYERYRATLVLLVVAVLSFLLLAFRRTSTVRYLRTFLVISTLPTERFLSTLKTIEPVELPPQAAPASVDISSSPASVLAVEQRRALQVLTEENKRLRELLDLKQRSWPQGVAAHVVGRDPQRWFQEIVLDKGKEEGFSIDDPVLSVVNNQEGLIGRIVEVGAHVSKVMLIEDSLSEVASTVRGEINEDGVVEGSNGHELILKYLDRSSHIKIGDLVVTSGLGKTFPEGVPIGWVRDLNLDPRQLFLQATLHPVVQANQLHRVLVLVGTK